MTEKDQHDLIFIEQIRQHVVESNIMLIYKGDISREIVLSLLKMTENKPEDSDTEYVQKSRIFNVMVNCLQNIGFHAAKGDFFKSGMLTIGERQGNYEIYSGNALKKDHIPELEDKLVQLSKMTKHELRNFYKECATNSKLPDRKEICQGLIDIAHKSGNDLDYDFDIINEEYSYYSLRTVIKPQDYSGLKTGFEKTTITRQRSLYHNFNLHKLIENNNIIFLYASDFSQELTKMLLTFTEKKLTNEDIEDISRRKIFNIMVEMLQNVSKNAVEKNKCGASYLPIFMIAESTSCYNLISSNKIGTDSIQKIQSRIDKVNSLDSAGLKQLYKEVRLTGTFSTIGGAGIGIIDMARKSGNKLRYDFQKIDEEYAMFSLLVTVHKTYS